jgi:peptide/nickel transport system ATP-binding protein
MDSTYAPLLRVAGLCVAYRAAGGAHVRALRSLDIEVAEREVVGVLGASGSGKSSLTQAVLRMLPRNAEIAEGQINFRHQDILNASRRELRAIRGGEIALISQEPALALNPVLSIGRQIDDVLKAHRPLSSAERQEKIQSMLRDVGFPDPDRIMRAYPHQLSGGQRQRAAIAQALICGPSLLMADEPLSALDTITQAEILDLLARLKLEKNLAMIFITHNAGVLSALADRMVVLRDGAPVASGTLDQLHLSSDPYVRGLLFPEENLFSDSQPHHSPVDREASVTPLLRVRGLSKTFTQKRLFGRRKFSVRALDEIEFDLEAGATTAIIGRSGSGKSTLARCIAGFEKPDTGSIQLHADVDSRSFSLSLSLSLSLRPVQLIFQDAGSALNPRFTAADIVAEPMLIAGGLNAAERKQRALELMEEVGLDPDWHRRTAHEFSVGQRQRLALARALAAGPQLLIMDESLAGLDLPLQAQMMRLLLDLQARRGLSYLYISHDLNFISLFAHDVMVMDQGRIVEKLPVWHLSQGSHPATQALVTAGERVHAPGVEVEQ